MSDVDLNYVGYCGVVCGKCGAHVKGRCKGCRVEPMFSRCPVRPCAIDKSLTSCADCQEDPFECKELNSLIAAIFRWILRRDRRKNLTAIKRVGIERFVVEGMDESRARKVPVA